MSNSSRPAYTLVIKSKDNSKQYTVAGVAFNSGHGLNLVLSPGVVLDWRDPVYFNLNPYETAQERNARYKQKYGGDSQATNNGDVKDGDGDNDDSWENDDLPF